MEKDYLSLVENCKGKTVQDVYLDIEQFVEGLMYLDRTILDVSKKWTNTNTWTSHPHIVKAYFGERLSAILKRILSCAETNDINERFHLKDFKGGLIEAIFDDIKSINNQ